MSYRNPIRETFAKRKAGRRRRRDFLETAHAMLVWNLTHGKGCRSKARAIDRRTK